MQSIKSVKNLKGKKVLLRADLNVPITKGKVDDPFRIIKALPTLTYLKKKGAIVVLISHIEKEGQASLKPVYDVLKKHIPLGFVPTKDFKSIETLLSHARPGTIILLENIRQFPGEKKNDQAFAKKLARLGDLYVNDAFSVSHRAHASIVGVPKYLPHYGGLQLEREVKELSQVFKPAHPFLFIIGGAKFESKLPIIQKYIASADNIFIGGALANQVFKEHGLFVGDSLVEKRNFGLKDLVKNAKVLLPVDVVSVKGSKKRNTTPDAILKGENMCDIGKESISLLIEKINKAKLILWSGPLGNTWRGYTYATKKILEAIAESKAISIIGGGDTVEVISKYNMERKFTFVSTGGGAMLEFLSKGTLPGIAVLNN
jgi:phosphoglycerate kinase